MSTTKTFGFIIPRKISVNEKFDEVIKALKLSNINIGYINNLYIEVIPGIMLHDGEYNNLDNSTLLKGTYEVI